MKDEIGARKQEMKNEIEAVKQEMKDMSVI
jgi:hypothetical protein